MRTIISSGYINWDAYWCSEIQDYCKGDQCIQMESNYYGDKFCRINHVMKKNKGSEETDPKEGEEDG